VEGSGAPSTSERATQPRIGVDEWVASAEERRVRTLAVRIEEALERVPPPLKLAALAVPFAVYPLLVDSEYLRQVGIDLLVFCLLVLGLNITAGWVGLLDLGYVAFFGTGAYLYAAVASEYAGRHWEAQFALPAIAIVTACLGFLLGLPSRRLVGDYLAIVTLFFLQLWLVVVLNAEFTRGPNGISDVLPLEFFGREVRSQTANYYVALVVFLAVIAALSLLNRSRTGRAWRAIREDELAAELMTMPVSRLKLLAFAFGAGIAGLAGAIFAPAQGAIFPTNFDVLVLITVYAMMVLGGAGSLFGVTAGAVIIVVSLEALRDPEDASWLFYVAVVLAILLLVKPWWRSLAVLTGTVAFGVVVHELASRLDPNLVAGVPFGQARIDELVDSWVLLPADIVGPDGLPTGALGRIAYLVFVAAVLGLTLVRSSRWRTIAFVPVLYFAACVWENLLLAQPAVARFVLMGALLVALMAYRPQGIFGKPRVEIV
jgi:branched-chain amino acid transport system permease protein